MAEKKQSRNANAKDRNTQTKRVIITVYVESPAIRSQKLSDPVKKSKPHSQFKRPRASESQAYDRRAQLLAYSRQLRNTGSESQEVKVPKTQKSRHKRNENCLWFEFCSPTSRMLRRSNSQWRYDRMPFNESKELNSSRKKKSNGKTTSPILRKLKSMLKEMSCKKLKL